MNQAKIVKAAFAITAATAEAIRDLGEIPNGYLYAQMMQHMSLAEYQDVIKTLKRAHLVEENNNVLKWIGG